MQTNGIQAFIGCYIESDMNKFITNAESEIDDVANGLLTWLFAKSDKKKSIQKKPLQWKEI